MATLLRFVYEKVPGDRFVVRDYSAKSANAQAEGLHGRSGKLYWSNDSGGLGKEVTDTEKKES